MVSYEAFKEAIETKIKEALEEKAKYPFWSAIITQQANSVDVPADTSVYVTIQPPEGETWLISLGFGIGIDEPMSMVWYEDYDGASAHIHGRFITGGSYGNIEPHLELTRIITNTLYCRILFYNSHTTNSATGYYGYSGFKLSKPLWTPRRQISTPPWKRSLTRNPIPKDVKPLKKFIIDVYDHASRRYRQAIILEENVVLARDPQTMFPVERLTTICYVDDFIKNILKPYKEGTLGLDRSGWKKYFDKWAEEGITL